MNETNTKLLETALSRYKAATEAWSEQRDRELEDLRFQIPELQWDEAARQQRQGGIVGGISAPARPTLSVDKISHPIRLIENQARAAKLGVTIHPVSEHATDDTARVLEGLYSRIQRDSNADQARLWAMSRAIRCGFGAYRVNTRIDDDAFEKFDLELAIERILYQECVTFDPAAREPDFSDGEYLFVSNWIPYDTFKRQFPDPDADDNAGIWEWADLRKNVPAWVREDGGGKAVLVCEYWYKVHTEEKVYRVKGKVVKKLLDGMAPEDERTRDVVTIRRALLTGMKTLEDVEWPGKYIPFVPVLGRELQPFDGKRRFEGMIRPARDPQKFFNYSISTLVERMSLEPKAPWIMVEGQEEGHEQEWLQSNTRNFPYLRYKAVDVEGKPAPPPQRAQLDNTGMSIALEGANMADSLIQASTATYDPSLGRTSKQDESGRKVLALQSQADAGTSDFLDNLASVSMRLEGLIVLDLIPLVYDARGRITTILTGEDQKAEKIMLGQPFTTDDQGRPSLSAANAEGALHYDFTKGRYAVAPEVGKSYQTRLQEGGAMFGELLQKNPALTPILGPSWLRFQDWPGAKEAADILLKVRDMQYPGLGDDAKVTAQQAQAKAQALEQQMQGMSQQLQQAVQYVKTEQAKHDAQIQIEQFKSQAGVELERIKADKDVTIQSMKDAALIEVAQINARAKGVLSESEARNEAIATAMGQAHDTVEAHRNRAHEVAMAHMQQVGAQQQAMQAGEQAQQQQDGQQQHEAGMQASDQSASMAQQQDAQAAAAEQAALTAQNQGGGE